MNEIDQAPPVNGGLSDSSTNAPDINLLDLLIALGQEKWTLILVTALSTIVGAYVTTTTPATYVARTSIMPSQSSSGGAGLASLGSLAGLSGIPGLAALSGMAGGIKSSDEMYIALMRSRSVQEALIEEMKLYERYGAKSLDDARQTLSQTVSISTDKKSGLLLIDAQDRDAEFAASLANAQVKQLNAILSRFSVTEAQQKRAYYDQAVAKTQAKLPQLESEFKALQRSSGVEVASLLSESGSLPGQIAAKELQLQVLSRFATSQNPELKKLAVEISALRSQLAKYELSKPAKKTDSSGSTAKPTDNARVNLLQKATQAYTALKIQEALLESYVKQLEIAKLEEAKEGPSLQVLDEAKAPENKANPDPKKIVRAYALAGFCLAFVLASLKALLRHVTSSPEGQARWVQLKKAWGFA